MGDEPLQRKKPEQARAESAQDTAETATPTGQAPLALAVPGRLAGGPPRPPRQDHDRMIRRNPTATNAPPRPPRPPNRRPPPPPRPHPLKKPNAKTHLPANDKHHPNLESLEPDQTIESMGYGPVGLSETQSQLSDSSGLTNWAQNTATSADWGQDPGSTPSQNALQYDAMDKFSSESQLGGGSELAMLGGIASLILIYRQRHEGEGGALETVGRVVDVASSATGFSSGATHLVEASEKMHERAGGQSTLTGQGNLYGLADSSQAAAGIDAGAGILSTIKAGIDIMKQAYDLITNWAEKDKQDVARGVTDMVGNLLKAARASCDAARGLLGQFDQGNSALIGLGHAVPGLGLCMQLAEILIRSFDMATSWHESAGRRVDKRTAKQKIGGKVGASSKDAAEAILADPNADETRKADAREYLLQKGLQNINDKRFRRALLKMGVAVTKAAGEGATLGGASAPVGFSLKLVGFAVDVGATLFRNIKQWGRNKAEKKHEERTKAGKAEKSTWEKIFNKDKSTNKKMAEYNRMVDGIFDAVLAAHAERDNQKKVALEKKVKSMVQSTGMRWNTFESTGNKDVGKLRSELIEAMRQRG